MRGFLAVSVCCALVAAAAAQHDPDSVWPQYRANNSKAGLVAAAGPATELDWVLEIEPVPNPADPNGAFSVIPSMGGFTVSGDGYIYYKSHDDYGSFVFKIDPDDSSYIMSENLGGAVGNYGGVAVGIDEVYVTIYGGEATPSIVVLDKTSLVVLDTFTNAAFAGMRGTPLLGDIPNDSGNVNIYVQDRNANKIHAVDSVTGDLKWSHDVAFSTSFSQLGPMWVTGDGRQAVAFFMNVPTSCDYPGAGVAVADNGDNTYEVLWEDVGPDSFNWIGSGAMSPDQSRIYVTTFWDCFTNALWALDVSDGSVIWGVPSLKGDPNEAEVAYNSFGRPAVAGNRVYIPGGFGVIACFEDLGNDYELKWELRDLEGEFTSVSAATHGDTVYVYGAKQGASELADGIEKFVVLRDDGDSYTELLRVALDQTTPQSTLYANNSLTIDADGSVYVGLGNAWDEDSNPGAIYKFSPVAPECPGDVDGDGDTDLTDLAALLTAYGSFEGQPNYNPAADFDSDGDVDLNDLAFLLSDYGCSG